MAERLLSMKQVRERVPVTKNTIYTWIAQGKFPKQVSLGAKLVAWREADVDSWIKARPEVAS
jgi:prophage regulatory protein